MEFHEAAGIFPLLEGDEFDSLVESIRDNGQLEPIELLDGKILDGRNRYRACLAAEVEPEMADITLHDGMEPVDYVWARNKERRHLTPGGLALATANRKKCHAKAAKDRKVESGKIHGRGQKVPANLPEPIEGAGDAREQAAAEVGLSGRTIDYAEKVVDKGSKPLQAAVVKGEIAVSTAAKVAELPKAEQTKALAGGKSAIKEAAIRGEAARKGEPAVKAPFVYKASNIVNGTLSNIVGTMQIIREDYGGFGEMIKRKDWSKGATIGVIQSLESIEKGIIKFNEEAKQHDPRKDDAGTAR